MEQTYSLRAVLEGDLTGTYLCHHGIKGQKWGVRRYQNPDGTLTEEGKKRYNLIQKRFTDPSGRFSTQRASRQTQLKNAGIGLLGGGVAINCAISALNFRQGGDGFANKRQLVSNQESMERLSRQRIV